ncbi:MAG: hypothetical protein EOP07_20495 [Proteobacteria bacterium]|nr:MAG: hypothetical protein EOP07_20495 [Pseudomonadota bacterium]
MPSSKDHLTQAMTDFEASQISLDSIASKFVEAIAKTMPEGNELKDQAVSVSSALERLLQRHHDDSRLIVSTSVALGEASEYEVPAFIQKLTRLTKFLEAPVAVHSVKTMKMANFVHIHPEALEIKHIDSIQTLARLPEGSVTKGLKKGEIQVGDTTIRIARADPKEINAAVRKVKDASAEVRKKEKAETIAQAIEDKKLLDARSDLDEADDRALQKALEDFDAEENTEADQTSVRGGFDDTDEDSLQPQLSEAASALSKVLGTLSQKNGHSQLSHVLSEARKLLMLAMRSEAFVIEPAEKIPDEATGDFH